MYRKVGIWRKKIEDTRHCLELQRGQVGLIKKERWKAYKKEEGGYSKRIKKNKASYRTMKMRMLGRR